MRGVSSALALWLCGALLATPSAWCVRQECTGNGVLGGSSGWYLIGKVLSLWLCVCIQALWRFWLPLWSEKVQVHAYCAWCEWESVGVQSVLVRYLWVAKGAFQCGLAGYLVGGCLWATVGGVLCAWGQ